MVKSYQRYEQDSCFGVIASNSNSVWLPPVDSSSKSSGRALSAGLEEILVWDIKTGELVQRLSDGIPPGAADVNSSTPPAQVTFLIHHAESQLVAAGYQDGTVKLWDLTSGAVLITFTGHRAAISCLKFDRTGTRLVSGSRDSNIIVWDLIGETGLMKLRSHKDQITGILLVSDSNLSKDADEMEDWLISTSKDGLIKLWDLKAQLCVETHLAHPGECWALAQNAGGNMLLTSGAEHELKVWQVNLSQDDDKLVELGNFEKQSKHKANAIEFRQVGNNEFFLVQNSERTVEVFRIRTADEIEKATKKREKRLLDKGLDPAEVDIAITASRISMLIAPFTTIRAQAKIRHASFAHSSSAKLEILVTLTNNSLEYHSISLPESVKKHDSNSPISTKQFVVDHQGHRADVRSVDISSDNMLLASASNGLLKVWNIRTTNCIRTFACGYALCVKFLPGGTLVVIGTRSGEIELYDLATSSLLHSLTAHEGAVWSLDLTPDGRSLVTGSADKTVKFWDLRVVNEEVPGTSKEVPVMKIHHSRTLELNDDVLAVKLSPDSRLVSVSLLDNTVKVFFFDSLKFFLSLYGHKLPVLSIDISFDSKLIVTSSADKNIKIWGLEFGDCHKSIFGHQDSIMSVKFAPGSHNIFSCSKDGLVKHWDGDKFECIQKLAGHQGEVWGLALASDASFVVSSSHDHSIRIWRETEEEVFLEEEREKEMDEIYESTLLKNLDNDMEESQKELSENEDEVARVSKQTVETLKAGEKLMEALDIGDKELSDQQDYHRQMQAFKLRKQALQPVEPNRNPVLVALNVNAPDYVLQTVLKIKPAQMEDALIVFPFSYSIKMLKFIQIWTDKDNISKNLTHLSAVCKILFFVVRNNYRELTAQKDESIKRQLSAVKQQLRSQLQANVHDLGLNLAGLRFAKDQWSLNHSTEFIDKYEQVEQDEKSAKKRVYTTVV